MTTYTPVPGVGPETPADHDYEGGFAAALMLKDLKLAMDAAEHAGAYTPIGSEAEELYQRFVESRRGLEGLFRHHQDARRQLESPRTEIGDRMRIAVLTALVSVSLAACGQEATPTNNSASNGAVNSAEAAEPVPIPAAAAHDQGGSAQDHARAA